ncbi:ABC transporter [Denitrobacterium detoxificans]|uniref:metal ABC transporter permease n=1 Tax=Denitrobacterium detoxificans TaxID=79604 RepID=UPI0007C9A601|nr:metal ABC transporter permease [Denitrobacterium detoxificans]ANE23274.1 ABC transporter [Denitrobacterium detoxificans]
MEARRARVVGPLEVLSTYLSYPFVVNALVVGALVALCSSLLGTTLVMKRLSYIGDGLSHVAFGAYAVASVAGITRNMLVIAPVTVLAAVVLLRRGRTAKVKGDAAISMMAVAALAFGYLVMNVFGARSNIAGDVCSTLFGSTSILTLTSLDVRLCAVMSIAVVGGFALLYNRIFAVTFDETFARACGMPVGRYNMVIAIMIALVIVVGMNLVGALMLSALVVFPALSAMRIAGTFRNVTIISACIGSLCAVVGMVASILAGTPVGPTIVLLDVVAFALCSVIRLFK